jgi:DNA repair protein RadA/Sms
MEGSRAILVEIQALVGQSAYSTPRRVGNGVEQNRLHQIVAVLERRLGLDFSRQDVYVNVVGGLRIDEPAADLAIAMAIIGSHRNLAVKTGTVMAGEIGLTGEIRPIRQCQNRLQEAARIGFQQMLVPEMELSAEAASLRVIPVATLSDAIRACFNPQGEARPLQNHENFLSEELV